MRKFKLPPLILIFILGFLLRIYGVNWDKGMLIHPDERIIVIYANQIDFFKNLDPHFYNYGSLPLYILKFISLFYPFVDLVYIGRFLSSLFDSLTIIIIYKITSELLKKSDIGIYAAFVYAIAFFPIQNSHFYTVDSLLTFLIAFTCYSLIRYSKKPALKHLVIIAISFAAMLATKFTAIIFLPIILLFIFFKSQRSIRTSLLFLSISIVFYFLFMPYAFLNNRRFITDTLLQISMSKNPYAFPYTLQFVTSIPYLHYLKQIVLWGLGPFISILFCIGIFQIRHAWKKIGLIGIYFITFFLTMGISAVKFMRYMLPLYPFLAIIAGYGLYKVKQPLRYIFVVLSLILLSFYMNIYTQTNTRIQASKWINEVIPPKTHLAVEYWDDYLPLNNNGKYVFNELRMYDQPDDINKWQRMNTQLMQSTYLIISSNRLYIPIQQLNDCTRYKICFPLTSLFYRGLFNNELPFRKVKEFTVYPSLTIGPWKLEINDDSAEESFTVFDHPKVMIFKKI